MSTLFDSDSGKRWGALSEEKKREILRQSYEPLQRVAISQMEYTRAWQARPDDRKSAKHLYVFATTEAFWECVSFALSLDGTEFGNLAHYPARTCTETFLQFFYFAHQDHETQDKIALMELMRPSVRLYRRGLRDGDDVKTHKEFFDENYEGLDLPEDIDDVQERQLNLFPNVRDLCAHYAGRSGGDEVILYFLYQWLCESVHGKLMGSVLRNQATDQEEYRRAVMLIYQFAKEILVLLDRDYLDQRFQSEVVGAIREADAVIRSAVREGRG